MRLTSRDWIGTCGLRRSASGETTQWSCARKGVFFQTIKTCLHFLPRIPFRRDRPARCEPSSGNIGSPLWQKKENTACGGGASWLGSTRQRFNSSLAGRSASRNGLSRWLLANKSAHLLIRASEFFTGEVEGLKRRPRKIKVLSLRKRPPRKRRSKENPPACSRGNHRWR
jgi:hypothetical protein